MNKIRIYSRGKYLGIEAIGDIDGLEDDDMEAIGFKAIVNADNFEITQEAYDLLSRVVRGDEEDLREIYCVKTEDGILFSWKGGDRALFDMDMTLSGPSFDFTLLEQFIRSDVHIPTEFINLCNPLIQDDITNGI